MPRPSINLEPYKDEIIHFFQNNTSSKRISIFLYQQYGIEVTSRTIESRLRSWGIRRKNRTASSDPVLLARIKLLFYQVGLEEREMLYALQQEGFDIQASTLKYIRHQQGLFRRVRNDVIAQAQVEDVLSQLKTEISTGQIEGYGQRLLQQHLRSQGYMISRYYISILYQV